MTLQWVSADARTGRLLADLPTLVPEYPLRRTLCRYDTAAADLYLDGAPENWQRATLEGGAWLACYDDDDPAQAIQWCGLVVEATPTTERDAVPLSLATAEAYFDRRTVGDVTYSARGQNAIVSDLIGRFVVDGADGEPGIPITVRYVTDGLGQPRDRTYKLNDGASVYARLTQLANVIGGPEWTVEWEWSSDRQSIQPVLLVGDRIGVAAVAGLAPAAAFDLPGCVSNASMLRSYAAGKGANRVMAYSSGEGDDTPTSGWVRAADYGGRPTFDHRWQPSSSITDPETLAGYARQAVAILAPGARPVTLEASLAAAPRLGSVWRLGDDVSYGIGGYDQRTGDFLTVKAFPGGVAGVGRAIAYELGKSTITPILAQAEVYTEAAE